MQCVMDSSSTCNYTCLLHYHNMGYQPPRPPPPFLPAIGPAGTTGSSGFSGANGIGGSGFMGSNGFSMTPAKWTHIAKYTFPILPKRCHITEKWMWGTKMYKVKILSPYISRVIEPVRWYSRDAYIVAALKDEII